VLDQILHHRGIGQDRNVTQPAFVTRRNLAKARRMISPECALGRPGTYCKGLMPAAASA
jgi:hypothetical protein